MPHAHQFPVPASAARSVGKTKHARARPHAERAPTECRGGVLLGKELARVPMSCWLSTSKLSAVAKRISVGMWESALPVESGPHCLSYQPSPAACVSTSTGAGSAEGGIARDINKRTPAAPAQCKHTR